MNFLFSLLDFKTAEQRWLFCTLMSIILNVISFACASDMALKGAFSILGMAVCAVMLGACMTLSFYAYRLERQERDSLANNNC